MTIFNKLLSLLIIFTSLLICTLVLPNRIFANTLIYHEDFEDGIADGWTEYENICGQWEVEEVSNNYIYVGEESNCLNPSQGIYTYYTDQKWRDSLFQFDLTGIEGIDKGVIFRKQDDDTFYSINVRALHYGDVVLAKYIDNKPEIQISYPYVTARDITYTLTVSIKNVQQGVHILVRDETNNNTIIDYLDNTTTPILDSGYIGFSVWPGNYEYHNRHTTITYIDNVFVYSFDKNLFNLPVHYENRGFEDENSGDFNDAFWNKTTAYFDHNRKGGFTNFLGDLYKNKDCKKGFIGLSCYNRHNGTDFDDRGGDKDVYSVANGEIVYISDFDDESEEGCKQKNGNSYGCVVIAKYNTEKGEYYGLYAHLDEVEDLSVGDLVIPEDKIGTMGNTGCKSCGKHLHFGVLRDVNGDQSSVLEANEWNTLIKALEEDLVDQDEAEAEAEPNAHCRYHAPNGMVFEYIDPSGWKGEGDDPWSLGEDEGGCAIKSPYLWKYELTRETGEIDLINDLKKLIKL